MKSATQKLIVTKEYGPVHSSDKKLWARIVQDWLAGKMSQRKFCKHHGLNKHTLSYWRSQFLAESKSKPAIVPVTVTSHSKASLQMQTNKPKLNASQTPNCIRLQTPKGYVFTLPLNVDAATLSTLLHTIGLNHA